MPRGVAPRPIAPGADAVREVPTGLDLHSGPGRRGTLAAFIGIFLADSTIRTPNLPTGDCMIGTSGTPGTIDAYAEGSAAACAARPGGRP